ncbi:beta family protein [Nocardiopsis sp. N85]|uniref:beta family protein n=1 Tax=Nocardiopsis sp. N85 TaxID=3029400 RepID=UPI00237EF6C8|nr:beta family protein [Nocardiopsis sp. N85]MDE3724764.1 beta family protein [Nocardiopsis sp. N85]
MSLSPETRVGASLDLSGNSMETSKGEISLPKEWESFLLKYVPALKGKLGEMEALWNLSNFQSVFPLLEVVGAEEGGSQKLGKNLKKLPSGTTVAVDGGPGGSEALSEVEEILRLGGEFSDSLLPPWTISVVPVIRYGDGYASLDVFQRLNEKYQSGYLLRLGSSESDPDVAEAESEVPLLLSNLGADPGEVDLVLDYGEVDSEREVERVTPSARLAVEWAARRRWRSVTLLSGAFPASISGFKVDHEHRLTRHEVSLWRAVSSHSPQEIELHYGDYATNHPALASGAGPWRSLPNLRYARGQEWIIHRKKAHREQENSPFYEICQSIVNDPRWEGENFSWADKMISRGARTYEGLGNAAKWVALGRSRHIEVVKHRLATLGEP